MSRFTVAVDVLNMLTEQCRRTDCSLVKRLERVERSILLVSSWLYAWVGQSGTFDSSTLCYRHVRRMEKRSFLFRDSISARNCTLVRIYKVQRYLCMYRNALSSTANSREKVMFLRTEAAKRFLRGKRRRSQATKSRRAWWRRYKERLLLADAKRSRAQWVACYRIPFHRFLCAEYKQN